VKINRSYDMRTDATRWQKSFETESREVYAHRKEIVAALELAPGTAIADVGAGSGLFTLEFARKVGKTGTVYAVEPQAYFRTMIEARAGAAKLANVRTVAADQRATHLAAASIDVAFLCDSYHHLELPHTYMSDLRRALRPGGKLVVVDYDRTVPGEDRSDHVRADPAQFQAEIERAGFTLVARPALLRENFVMVFEAP
jgi:predicted methyltransferase